MSATIANGVAKAAGPGVGLRPLQVLDLAGRPDQRSLWRFGGPAEAPPADLPRAGWASPLGFWLTPVEERSPRAPGGRLIAFHPPTSPPSPPPAQGVGRRPTLTARLKATHTGDGDLILVIGAGFAHVHATAAAWEAAAEPVLLAICLYWRFAEVDAELDRLTALAHGDLGHAAMPGAASLRGGRRLVETAREVRALLVDLPHFEGPLTDPLPYVSSERAAQAFETLAEKLRLEPWCELIDERAEAVEDTYEAVTEKLFEYRNFAVEAALEAVIIVILVAELALMTWDAVTP